MRHLIKFFFSITFAIKILNANVEKSKTFVRNCFMKSANGAVIFLINMFPAWRVRKDLVRINDLL